MPAGLIGNPALASACGLTHRGELLWTGLASQNRLQSPFAKRRTSIRISPPTSPAPRKSLHTLVSLRGQSRYNTLRNLSPHPESNVIKLLHTVEVSKKRTNYSVLSIPLVFFLALPFLFARSSYSFGFIPVWFLTAQSQSTPRLIYTVLKTLCSKEISLPLDSGSTWTDCLLYGNQSRNSRSAQVGPHCDPFGCSGLILLWEIYSPILSPLSSFSNREKKLASSTVHQAKLSKNAAGLLVPSH